MKENPYKRLLPLERRPDGTPYRRNAGSGDLPGQGLETLCGLRRCVRPKSNRGNTAPTAPPKFTGGRKQKVNGKGGLLWTVRQEKSLDLKALHTRIPKSFPLFLHKKDKNLIHLAVLSHVKSHTFLRISIHNNFVLISSS